MDQVSDRDDGGVDSNQRGQGPMRSPSDVLGIDRDGEMFDG